MPISRPSNPPDVAEVASTFGLGRVLGLPAVAARGEMGRIWRLETATGTWALKEVFTVEPSAVADARADAAFQELALARGIPMPRPVRALDSRVLVTVGPAADLRSVRVYSWVDLRPRDAVAPLADVAAILGRLHAIAPPDRRAIHPWYRQPPDSAVWPLGVLMRAVLRVGS